MSQPAEQVSVRARAIAGPGLLAKLAAVLNPHPVASFDFAESPDGTATVVVRLVSDEHGRADWHLARVIARLGRVVGVTSVESDPSAD